MRSPDVQSLVSSVAEDPRRFGEFTVSDEPEGRYEVVDGKIVEKPSMGAFEAWTASVLFGFLHRTDGVRARGFTVSEMMFVLDADRKLERRPDLAFVSYERWAQNRPVPRTPAWDVIPDLAIEVISPSNSASGVLVKVGDYFRHGVREVWVVYPLEEQVYVYRSPTSVRVLTRSDSLESPDILPGFQVPLVQLFEAQGAD
jgi:Uma2 family endonuclease